MSAASLTFSPAEPVNAQPRSLRSIFWMRLRANRLALVAGVILLVIILAVVAAPLLTPYERDEQNLRQRFLPPSSAHLMGTDDLGRDVWTRVLYGGRVSLAVGALAVTVSIIVGVLVGLASGFFGSWLDSLLMRATDIFLAVPRYFVLILLAVYLRALDLPWAQAGSFAPIAVVIGVFAWMGVARLVRASTLEAREREYITAARCLGVRNWRILFGHILPNVASPIIVAASLGLAGAIITESGLSYLGLGVQLPTPTWGNMLSNTQTYLTTAPWMALFPGLMIFLVVLCINYIGDALRDALDPRSIVGK